MSDDKKPSLDDFTDNTEELPSVDEFITEEVKRCRRREGI